MSNFSVTDKKIGIIGTGAVGAALAEILNNAGYTVVSLAGRDEERTKSVAGKFGVKHYSKNNEETVDRSDVIFLCLPDDALTDEIKRLAGKAGELKGKIVYHTSGAVSSAVFKPMREKGAVAASFHPLQTVPRDGKSTNFKDRAIAIEVTMRRSIFAVSIVKTVGAYPMLLQEEQKALYHTTATLASNGLVGLAGVVEELIGTVGLEEEGRQYFYRLMEQSLKNSEELTAPTAITGPASRGDIATLKNHLDELRQSAPHIVPIYIVAGSHCVNLAIRSGKLSSERGEAILDLFSRELHSLTM
jgi:predicted short-subunit dehydrogenase-like oxidoreductase (DUF2520 family)